MKPKKQRADPLARAMFFVCVAMVLIAVACFSGWLWLSHLLQSQKEAQRWQGEGEMAFSQISCFLPADKKIGLREIADFRNAAMKKLKEASLDINGDQQLMLDAWSTSAKLYTSGEHGRGEASVIAVGGDYFDFHPLRLLDGDYIRQSDLMKDRIVLGEEVAWLLFGGTNLAGMEMKLNGKPFVIAGVVQKEQDFASKKANEDLDLYMSYDALLQIDENAKINCYEYVMAEPVKNFAMNVALDKFPIGGGEIVCNTTRYDYGKMMSLAIHYGDRGSRTSGAVLPYWENAARRTENWGALCCFLGTILLIYPATALIAWIFHSGKRWKAKMEDDILPEVKDRTEEAVRVRQRKRWERRHREQEKEE